MFHGGRGRDSVRNRSADCAAPPVYRTRPAVYLPPTRTAPLALLDPIFLGTESRVTCGRSLIRSGLETASQAEYAGSIPVIGSTKPPGQHNIPFHFDPPSSIPDRRLTVHLSDTSPNIVCHVNIQ
jgi:hypothetical protein